MIQLKEIKTIKLNVNKNVITMLVDDSIINIINNFS